MTEPIKLTNSTVLIPGGETLNQPKILITGATGLVGSHLLNHLVSMQTPVRALQRGQVSNKLQNGTVEWVEGDILDVIAMQQAMENIEQVYHCAAVVSFNPANRSAMFKTNIEGTANVVNAAINAGVKKLVFVSSVAALGRIRPGQIINETMSWTKETSNSNYGKSKYLAELEVWRGIGEGLKAVMVNPVIILGAADWNKGSAGIFKSTYNEFPWFTEGSGGFVDVLDVVNAMVQLMESDISGERFIISAENTTYRQIFTMIANEFSKKPPHKRVTPFLASLIWRLEKLKSIFKKTDPLLTKETAETALTHAAFDNRKLLLHLPQFAYTPLQKTIERVCNEILLLNNPGKK